VAKKKKNQAVKHPAKPVSNAKGSTKKQVKTKKRGALLAFLIIVIFLHSVFATLLARSTLKAEYAGSTSWVLPVLALVSLAGIVAAVGMWYWKKWGITLYAVTCVVQAAIHLMLTGSLMVVFYDLLPVAILAYVVTLQSKMNLFE
jgi:hypothetical protein